MEDYKVRVLVEHFELAIKIRKLDLYLKKPNCSDKDLLEQQLVAMLDYQRILEERIEKWIKED